MRGEHIHINWQWLYVYIYINIPTYNFPYEKKEVRLCQRKKEGNTMTRTIYHMHYIKKKLFSLNYFLLPARKWKKKLQDYYYIYYIRHREILKREEKTTFARHLSNSSHVNQIMVLGARDSHNLSHSSSASISLIIVMILSLHIYKQITTHHFSFEFYIIPLMLLLYSHNTEP